MLVVLVEPLYEINLGYVARAMKNFGFTELVLVDPKCTVGDEARKYAMHGRDLLERVRIAGSLTEVLREVDLAVGTTGKTGGRRCYHRKYVTPEELGELLAETEGILPGGGVALLRAVSIFDELEKSGEFKHDEVQAIAILRKALREPIKQIAENAGIRGDIIAHQVEKNTGKVSFGWDAMKEEFGDLFGMHFRIDATLQCGPAHRAVHVSGVDVVSSQCFRHQCGHGTFAAGRGSVDCYLIVWHGCVQTFTAAVSSGCFRERLYPPAAPVRSAQWERHPHHP